MSQPKEYKLRLLEAVQETPEVRLFRFEYPDDKEFYFYPGQFVMLSFIDNEEIKYGRAYSIASSPENKKYIEIGLNKIAKFTQKLFETKTGALMKINGPFGKFYFNEEIKNEVVLIGAGTGIAPLICIARYAADKKLPNKIKMVYSSKTPELIIYRNEIDRLKEKNKNFAYYITITRPEGTDWDGPTGRINEETLKKEIGKSKDKTYFLCGSNDFVKTIISYLEKFGVAKEQIKTDVWGNK